MAVERVESQLRDFTRALDAAGIPYAVVGGNAVEAWVLSIAPDATRATRDADVLIRREDMAQIVQAVRSIGMAPVLLGQARDANLLGAETFASDAGAARDELQVISYGV